MLPMYGPDECNKNYSYNYNYCKMPEINGSGVHASVVTSFARRKEQYSFLAICL
jgi:hypothetical protein